MRRASEVGLVLAAASVVIASCRAGERDAAIPAAGDAASPGVEERTRGATSDAAAVAAETDAGAPVAVAAAGRTNTPARAMTAVLVATDGRAVSVFPVGGRALIADGPGLHGYALPKADPVRDPSVGRGLPARAGSRPQHVGGVWPRVALSHGEKDFAHYAGPPTLLHVLRDGAFVAEKTVPGEVPRGVAVGNDGKDTIYAFTPSPGYFMAGYGCKTMPPGDDGALVLAVRGGKKAAPPGLPASFFPRSFVTDGSGSGWAVGADACAYGAFIAALDSARSRLELVPSSADCTARWSVDGMPFTQAHAFPAADGGLHVLSLSVHVDGTPGPPPGPCSAPPRVISRSSKGAWSDWRNLPRIDGEVAYVDPAGTSWAILTSGVVARIPVLGPVDRIPLDNSCAYPGGDRKERATIETLVVPFPDQPWISVRAGGVTALCWAPMDRP